MSEPATPEAVAAWVAAARRERDPFEPVRIASEDHRAAHGEGCTVYPTGSGPLLGVLATAISARRALEIGTGLGYSALWLAASRAAVDTVERDPEHARLARGHLAGRSIAVLDGWASEVLPGLDGPYDILFSDSDPREMPTVLEHAPRLLRPGGLLVSSNLFLAQFVPDLPDLERMAEYRTRLLADDRFLTAFAPDGLALSVLRTRA